VPDLATHAIGGYLLSRFPQIFSQKPSENGLVVSSFVFGNILPDITTRPAFLLFPKTFDYVFFIHTPFVMLLISALIATFLNSNVRLKAGIFMFTGSIMHMVLDHFQSHIFYPNYWFFPIYNEPSGIDLYGVDSSLTMLPYLFFVFIVVLIYSCRSKKQLSGTIKAVCTRKVFTE